MYQQASRYQGDFRLPNPGDARQTIEVPQDLGDRGIHLVLELRDNGSPELVAYRRTSSVMVSHFQFRPRPLRFICAIVVLLPASCRSAQTLPVGPEGQELDRPGFYVEGRHLYDRCGEEVVLRGINRMTVVKDRDGIPSFPEIAKTGANTVRIMWMMWRPAAEVGAAVANAVRHGLNEAGDHRVTDEQFKDGYRRAIRRMREAGVRTPLMIDAAGWGRNEVQLLRVARSLLEQDPDNNLIFSWHPWDPGDQEQRITQAMERSVALDIPFVIGEFSHTTVGCAGEVPYRHIMAEAQRLGIGWLAWSWGPGNADCASMDMTTDSTFETLHGWGLEAAVTDPNSIRNTSVRPHSIVHGQCRAARGS